MWAVASLITIGATAIAIADGQLAVAVGMAAAAAIAGTALKVSLELTASVASGLAHHGRSLESISETVRQQHQTSEAILNRIRTLETATGQQHQTNETILNRIRTLEGRTTVAETRAVSMSMKVHDLDVGLTRLSNVASAARKHRNALNIPPELILSKELRGLRLSVQTQRPEPRTGPNRPSEE